MSRRPPELLHPCRLMYLEDIFNDLHFRIVR